MVCCCEEVSMRALRPLLLAATLAAAAPAAAQDLTLGLAADPSPDPHFLFLDTNVAFARHIHGALTAMGTGADVLPDLAASWRLIDDTTWEFTLRPGAAFADGTPVTAEDFAWSVNRIRTLPNNPGPYTPNVASITAIETPAPDRIILRTNVPNPILGSQLSNVIVLSKRAAEGASMADFAGGRAAVGAGPYRIDSFARGDRIVLTRNPAWNGTQWGGRPHWNRITMRQLTNDGARTAALLSGDVDFIEFVAPADIARLRGDARFAIHTGPSSRTIYFLLDVGREVSPKVTDAQGRPLQPNPLRDIRVRQAMGHAINREAITGRLMEGLASPTVQVAAPGILGRVDGLAYDAFDPDRGRRLLAEAGYPEGFNLAVSCPNNRFVNDERICQAVAQMLARIGIRASVEAMPMAVYFGQLSNPAGSAFSMGMMGLSQGNGEATSLNVSFHTMDRAAGRGGFNFGRFSNAEVDRLVVTALTTMDRDQREVRMQAAVRAVMAERPVLPIHDQMVVTASRAHLVFTTALNEHTLAMRILPR
jgi:peptide/nickel transport system substrate-binding protein